MSELSGSQWELAYHALKMFQNISVLETDVGDSPKRDLSGTLAVKLEMMGKRPQVRPSVDDGCPPYHFLEFLVLRFYRG